MVIRIRSGPSLRLLRKRIEMIKFVLFCFEFDMKKSSGNSKFEFLEIIFSAYNFPNSQLLNIFLQLT